MKTIKQVLASALELIGKIEFKQSDDKATYALEFILMLIGEKANAIIVELKEYCENNPAIIDKLHEMGLELDKTLVNKQSFDEHFRNTLNQTPLGKLLMLHNRIRNRIDHNIQDLSIEEHKMMHTACEEFPHIIKNFNLLKQIFTSDDDDDTKIIAFFSASSASITTLMNLPKIAENLELIEKTKKKAREDKKKAIKEAGAKPEHIKAQHEKIQNLANNLLQELIHIKNFTAQNLDDQISFYATCMPIIYLGAQAGVLINVKLNQKDVSEEDKNIIRKYEKELKKLYDMRTKLAHLQLGLPKKI